MSEDVERVARALYDSFNSESYGAVNVPPWDEKRNPDRSRWIAHASAAIAAMTPALQVVTVAELRKLDDDTALRDRFGHVGVIYDGRIWYIDVDSFPFDYAMKNFGPFAVLYPHPTPAI